MENNNKKKTVPSILKSKKFIVCVIIFAFITISVIGSLVQYKYNSTDPKPLYLEILCYSTQITSSIFVIAGVVIAVWQYYLSSKDSKTNLELVQVQRAIDLSEYYKDNILRYYPAIYYIYDATGIANILEIVATKTVTNFDSYELKTIFTPSQIEELKKILDSDAFFRAVIEANDIYHLGFKFHEKEVEISKDGSKTTQILVNKNSVVVAYLSNLVNRVLNNLEYFALHFRHNTADESVVYQSLHQSFLEMVPYLYYYIAKQNTDSSNKLYTNVIWLYCKWRQKKEEQNADRAEKSLSVLSHGTIIKKES